MGCPKSPSSFFGSTLSQSILSFHDDRTNALFCHDRIDGVHNMDESQDWIGYRKCQVPRFTTQVGQPSNRGMYSAINGSEWDVQAAHALHVNENGKESKVKK